MDGFWVFLILRFVPERVAVLWFECLLFLLCLVIVLVGFAHFARLFCCRVCDLLFLVWFLKVLLHVNSMCCIGCVVLVGLVRCELLWFCRLLCAWDRNEWGFVRVIYFFVCHACM